MADHNPSPAAPDGTDDIVQIPIPDEIDRLADRFGDDPIANALTAHALHSVAARLRRGDTHVLRRDPAATARTEPRSYDYHFGGLPHIADGITDAEAQASAEFDLTIDEVRAAGAEQLLDAARADARWSQALQSAVQLQVARIRTGLPMVDPDANVIIETACRFAEYLGTGT